MIFALYVLSVLAALLLFCYDWYKSLDELRVGDVLLMSILSAIPVCGLGAALFVTLVRFINNSKILSKRIL